jgi:hypothetical protein
MTYMHFLPIRATCHANLFLFDFIILVQYLYLSDFQQRIAYIKRALGV